MHRRWKLELLLNVVWLSCVIGTSYLVNNGKHRYVARVCYDGTAYRGWQEQDPKTRTVQATISRELTRRFGTTIKVSGASRTDFGVHARGQACHFDLEPNQMKGSLQNFEFTFNQMLPKDIKISNVSYAPFGTPEQVVTDDIFHATKSAVGKLYVYRFCTNTFVDPIFRNYYAHFYRPMNMQLFEACLQKFVGTHDFRAFGNRLEKLAKQYEGTRYADIDTIRTVHSAKLIDEGGGYYRIEFHIKSALYRMIRNIVGTSAFVATGMMDEVTLQSLITAAPSRQENCAMSAVPHGLTLEHVYYDNY